MFELEGSLLASYGKILAASHRKGVPLLESEANIPSDGVSVSSNYPNLGHASPEKDVSALQRNIEDAAVQGWTSSKSCMARLRINPWTLTNS